MTTNENKKHKKPTQLHFNESFNGHELTANPKFLSKAKFYIVRPPRHAWWKTVKNTLRRSLGNDVNDCIWDKISDQTKRTKNTTTIYYQHTQTQKTQDLMTRFFVLLVLLTPSFFIKIRRIRRLGSSPPILLFAPFVFFVLRMLLFV